MLCLPFDMARKQTVTFKGEKVLGVAPTVGRKRHTPRLGK